jgi:hypothetical protein
MSVGKGRVKEIIDEKYVEQEKKSYGQVVVILKN